jgi:regulator of protease activity HflC (stomatin/prohibitin superfamily)
VPVNEAPTKDNVRISLGTLITFSIIEPFKFVYNLSASDFDRVFQSACQNVLRTMIREVSSSEVNDLTGRDVSDLRTVLSASVEAYGVQVQKINFTSARPPADFLASHEARELAIVQQVEQAQKQSLAQRLQADQEVLARQAVIAQVARDNEALQGSIQAAQNRKRLIELEAETERLRLEKLQERLLAFPIAAQWEVESAQLDIARGLAGNTHAVVQVGGVGDIPKAFMFAEVLKSAGAQPTDGTPYSGNSSPNTEQVVNLESQDGNR